MQDIKQLLEQLNIPVAYHHFNTDINPPFVVYYRNASNNYGADNKVLKKINTVYIELYTEYKDLAMEQVLEDLLDEHEIFYDVLSEDYISDEKMYQVIYEISICNNEETLSI